MIVEAMKTMNHVPSTKDGIIKEIIVDGKILDENSDFNILLSEERVERIIEKIKEFDCDDGNVRGLMFCSRVEEAEKLSIKLNALDVAEIPIEVNMIEKT